MTLFGLSLLLTLLPGVPSTAGAVLTCGGEPATIVGTSGDDILVGTSGDDVIVGLGGNDRIYGKWGNDLLCGNRGWDRIYPGTGVDYVNGGLGSRDWVYYTTAKRGVVVSLTTGVGAGQGRDTLASIENIVGSRYGDTLVGNARNNRIIAGAGDDSVYGRDGDDLVWGQTGDDVLWGQAGNDKLNGGAGFDSCHGEHEVNCEAAGSGGPLVLRHSLAPRTLNPYLLRSSSDLQAASLVLEPLAEVNPDGKLVPVLATRLPTVANGGVAPDFTSITWNLRNTVWSDGTRLAARDVVFTYEYCSNPLTGCAPGFSGVASVVALDPRTVKITFDSPTPYPYLPFVGFESPILQRAQFRNCVGAAAEACTAENHAPIGTGPFRVAEFRPDDGARYVFNPRYRGNARGQPFFGTVEIIGGGDSLAAARSVMRFRTADYAWNLQVDPALLASLEGRGIGAVKSGLTSNVEHINLNQTDPGGIPPSDYNGGANHNPFFFENTILHDALSMAIDRNEIVAVGYGSGYYGIPTCNMWIASTETSTNNDSCLTQDIAGANALLDANGYVDGDNDGVRETPGGLPLEFEFVTSTNAVRQATQSLIQGYWDQIGVATTMRHENAGHFFDGTCASDACLWKFFTDIQMFTNGTPTPDAADYLGGWTIAQIPESTNGWIPTNNVVRLASPQFDNLHAQLLAAPVGDPARNGLAIQLNDIIVDYSTIPLVNRGSASAIANSITGHGDLNAWDSEYWNIEHWRRRS